MSTTINDVDFALLYIDNIPSNYFDEIRQVAEDDGLNLLEEPRENEPFMAIEWVVPAAVSVYIGLKFIDAFLKRAADDVADAVYPKFKTALINLAKKVLVQDRDKFSVFSSSPKKITNTHSLIFSIYSETKLNRRLKFVFHRELPENEYEKCIEKIFSLLHEHHLSENNEDHLSLAITEVSNLGTREVYLLYNPESSEWELVDPIKETLKRQADENQ